MRRALLAILLFSTEASAGRPPEALSAARAEAEAEARDLERRARALDEQTEGRESRLKRRLRALYKLSSGGYVRLLARAETPSELAAREQALERILERDLDELKAVRDEARAIDADHARRSDAIAAALERENEAARAVSEPPTGLAVLRGRLSRPVPGPIVAGFGARPDGDRGITVSRRGVDLEAARGEPVRAVAAGQVRWAGEVPGLGKGVIVDHGDGYLTLTARLGLIAVEPGAPVGDGGVLGKAHGPSVFFELTQGGTPLDPAGWLRR